MTKRFLLVFFFMTMAASGAHEFWFEASPFTAKEVQSSNIQIKVGMNFSGKAWTGDLTKTLELSSFYDGQKRSLIDSGPPREPNFEFSPLGPGQSLLGFTNKSSFIKLSASEFEKYVLSDGLDYIVQARRKLGESQKAGRENYRRCAKILLQFGERENVAPAYAEEFGFPLELSSLGDPYGQASPSQLEFSLKHQQKPLAEAKVFVWHKLGDKVKKQEFVTDSEGHISFPVEQSGTWMVTSVHMVRATDSEKADWQSYWASYSWGFEG